MKKSSSTRRLQTENAPRPKQSAASKRRPLEKLLPFVLLILAATVAWRVWQYAYSPKRLLIEARQALESKRYAAAEDICKRILSIRPESPEALLLAGKAAAEQDRLTDAAAYYDRIAAEAGEDAVNARSAAGDLWLELGHATKAEIAFRQALQINPRDAVANERLALLLTAENRRFESLPHMYELLRQRRASHDILLLVGEHMQTVDMSGQLTRFRSAAPDDPAPLIGMARLELRRKNYAEAARLLGQVLARSPELIEAYAVLGRTYLDEGNENELARWAAELPPEADAHPDVWLVRGGWAKRRSEMEAAARCLWEALRRDPNHQLATLQLSQVLRALGESEKAEGVAARASVLSDYSATLSELFQRKNAKMLFRAARQAETLGRLWEAWAWNQSALSNLGEVEWAREGLSRIEPQLNDALPPTLPQVDLGIQLDLSHYPLPSDRVPSRTMATLPATPRSPNPRFEDIAEQAGITFIHFCGREGTQPRAKMFQLTGGGIAVADYDLDGWPDLYFTQGCRWPPQAGQDEHLDAIYRNLGNGRFQEVTQASRLGDDRFSQGTTVGDINNDGFPDLYVANIGVNRLYLNNGDGTFDDVSDSAGISADRWTTSCLLADLNSDGLPDLYDVNYLHGPHIYELVCSDNGVPRSCTPGTFEPLADEFYLNSGDGRFEEMTGAAGLRARGGNGLGVVASNFSGSGRLDLFIANDQDPNFYFVNRTPVPGRRPKFEECGLIAGLAFNGSGKATASMGVAAGDANGDGKMDLFITNFEHEANTLFLQEDAESFVDVSGSAGLAEASFTMLGFGTQFIDGELDGLADLVVANGHVHELSSPGVSYAMRPQYFRNMGGGRYQEISANSLGAYFQQRYFGRGLVRLDWNRDGREDFAVNSLEAPAALVTNRTEQAGHYLAVQLRGVQSSRDAIGAVVTITAGGRRQTQWLNAGDGYQASNQRQLVFGLGDSTQIDELSIAWPTGAMQNFRHLAADQELMFVENSPRSTVVPL